MTELISNTKRGSSTVEAALVVPLIVLIVAGLVGAGIRLERKVEDSSKQHVEDADEVLINRIDNVEDILRGRWVFE